MLQLNVAADDLTSSMKLVRVQGIQAIEMNLGSTISLIAQSPESALTMAETLRVKVHGWCGVLSYDNQSLPIVVLADQEKRLVESRLPESIDVLVANPELYLAWADQIEIAADKLLVPHHD